MFHYCPWSDGCANHIVLSVPSTLRCASSSSTYIHTYTYRERERERERERGRQAGRQAQRPRQESGLGQWEVVRLSSTRSPLRFFCFASVSSHGLSVSQPLVFVHTTFSLFLCVCVCELLVSGLSSVLIAEACREQQLGLPRVPVTAWPAVLGSDCCPWPGQLYWGLTAVLAWPAVLGSDCCPWPGQLSWGLTAVPGLASCPGV